MKNKLKIVSCALFLSAAVVCAVAVLPLDGFGLSEELKNASSVKAGTDYTITLNGSNKYISGTSKSISTDRNNGATVEFAYNSTSQSDNGHVVLDNGGTLKNIDQFTSLFSFKPVFSVGSGATLKFRASNDGSNWGEFVSIKPYSDGIESDLFELPYMKYVEFKADGGSVDINSIVFTYTCDSGDSTGANNYECGTTFVDSNLNGYETGASYNSQNGLVVSTLFNGGSTSVLDSSKYEITVNDSSNAVVDKTANLSAGTYTAILSRKDKAFADVSYNFTVVAPKFTVTTDLTETKEIHTTQQKTYLSYTGDYATIDPSLYPNGDQLLSDSLPVALAWNYTPISGKTLSNYSVTYGQKSDLSDGYEVVGTTTKSLDLYNPYLGTNYFKINANYSDKTVESSPIKTFQVDETGPRNLAVGNMTNCRDMGGRTTIAGAKIKQGLLYRTCGKNYDNKGMTLNDTAKSIMLNQLKLKTEINVSNNDNNLIALNDTTTYGCYMDYASQTGVSKHHFSRNAESVKNVFKILANENNYPLYYHCRIGTDRTGLVGNLVYGLLGVPLNTIYQDYLFSNFGKIGEKRYIGSQAGQDDISIYMDEIISMPGDTFQEKTYNTLLSIGVARETLDSVIDILTDGPKCDNEQGQIVVNANDMELSGTSLVYTEKTSPTERSNPEYYATLSNNASASFGFETTEAGDAKIYAYIGHNEYTTSKTLSGSLTLNVDGNTITVPSTNFQTAGMGAISSRTNYYFVKIGEISNLAAGNHTITITGKANSMKLGALSIFDVPGQMKIIENYPTGISFDSSTGSLNVGDTKQLNVTYSPANTNAGKGVTYSSNNESVATVDSNGLITAIGGGSAVITAVSTYNANITTTFTLTVKEPSPHTYSEHTWGSGSKYSTAGITVTKYSCSCGTNKLEFDSLDGTYASGSSNKSGTPTPYLKLKSDGNSISYTFTLPAGVSGKLCINAIMDSWTNNSTRGFFNDNNNTTTPNFSIQVNNNALNIDQLKGITYSSVWSTSESQTISKNTYSKDAVIEIGDISLNSGSNTIKFSRNASYNPLISKFIIVY